MQWSSGGRALRAKRRHTAWPSALLAAVCLMTLVACNQEERPATLAGQPRGATVAFESIDGPPPGQFHQLVRDLNDEAQTRRLAVMSRESPSAYRVRGYLAAKVEHKRTTISWVWDVFYQDDHRALRITGEETAKGKHHDAWAAADDDMLQRIAHSSMDQLAAFLTSPEVAPSTPDVAETASVPQLMLAGMHDFSPEAAGIFRIFRHNGDPVPSEGEEPADADNADPVPLPRSRPPVATEVSTRDTLTLAASQY
jgi:hypothetical protein